MLTFTEEFLAEENREDFTIPAMMKKVWATELEIADYVLRLCREYDLAIYAAWGTLLGAVRHKGFIPWDDDMDFEMPREDYRRLFRLLSDIEAGRLPGEALPFHVSSVANNPNHFSPSMSVENHPRVPIPEEIQLRYRGLPYVAGIDIFPLDYYARDKEFALTQYNLYRILWDIGQGYEEHLAAGTLGSKIAFAEDLCNTSFVRDDTLRAQIWQMIDRVSALTPPEEAQCLTSYWAKTVRGTEEKNFLFPFDWYGAVNMLPFENITVPVPIGFEQILTMLYGDYRVPVRNAAGHDYPYYKEQEQFLQSR